MISEKRQHVERREGECFAKMRQCSAFIAPIELEISHGKVGIVVFWTLLDRSAEPASALGGVPQLDKQEADEREGGSISTIQLRGLRVPDHGVVQAPRNVPVMPPDELMTPGEVGVDLEGSLVPVETLVESTDPLKRVPEARDRLERQRIQLDRLSPQRQRFLVASQALPQQVAVPEIREHGAGIQSQGPLECRLGTLDFILVVLDGAHRDVRLRQALVEIQSLVRGDPGPREHLARWLIADLGQLEVAERQMRMGQGEIRIELDGALEVAYPLGAARGGEVREALLAQQICLIGFEVLGRRRRQPIALLR